MLLNYIKFLCFNIQNLHFIILLNRNPCIQHRTEYYGILHTKGVNTITKVNTYNKESRVVSHAFIIQLMLNGMSVLMRNEGWNFVYQMCLSTNNGRRKILTGKKPGGIGPPGGIPSCGGICPNGLCAAGFWKDKNRNYKKKKEIFKITYKIWYSKWTWCWKECYSLRIYCDCFKMDFEN